MTALNYLSDPDDDRVSEALKRRCGICKAPPGRDCESTFGGNLGRIVHQERAEQHYDKRKKRG